MNLIHHHLGLGDHIICNGLVRTKAEMWGNVHVFCKQANANRVARMYEDDPRIDIVIIPKEADEYAYTSAYAAEKHANLLRCGFDLIQKMPGLNFDEVFYIGSGIPFAKRWDAFKIVRHHDREQEAISKLNPTSEPYIFVHDDPSRGFSFDVPNPHNLKIVKNDITICPFDMIGFFEGATEIHCMESSLKCLIESIPSIECRLYFHRKIREMPDGSASISRTRKEWIVV
jgi:hypothetical protein